MTNETWFLITAGFAVAFSLMTIVWVVAKVINNAGIVDIAWSLGFAVLVWIYGYAGTASPDRRWLLIAMVTIWSLRLGIHLWRRVAHHHPEEDGRYLTLREQFPQNTWLMFFGFFQLQAVLLVLLSLPFAMAMGNSTASLSAWEWAGFIIWLVAFVGESVADAQLNAFKSDPANKGEVCQRGLWKFSRHPNYFFEWMIWVGFFVFALGSRDGWITIYCPLLMLYFLLKVTGVPAAEEQSLKSRGDKYREYQQTTSVFVPWFRRTQPSPSR